MPSGEVEPAQTKDLETGEVLNSAWRLEEKIGEGGMGRVFRATDLKLARKAAVKALSIGNLDDETVKRFEREAQVMGKLDHPGVVTLYGVGRTRGIPWLAMKHLEGKSLWGILDDHGGRMAPEVLLPIARQLLGALSYIHQRGLLHRDLKPSNIHVGPTGKTTLLDLGLAREHQSTLTRTGVVWGTPDYMAPEQIVGERQLDGRADLYSLSVVFYRMLSGSPPFSEADEQELMRAHLMRPRPDISRLVPTLSTSVGLALQKGLAIRPEDRFQSADEMLESLERALTAQARESAATSVSLAPVLEPEVTPRVGMLAPDLTPKAPLRRSGEKPVLAKTDGRRITGKHPAAANPTRPSRPSSPRPPPPAAPVRQALSLEDDDEGHSAGTQREGFGALASTRPEGFAPLPAPLATVVETDSGPTLTAEQPTAPSDAAARPMRETPPLPMYLSPPYLIGGAVLMLALGILLGKLL